MLALKFWISCKVIQGPDQINSLLSISQILDVIGNLQGAWILSMSSFQKRGNRMFSLCSLCQFVHGYIVVINNFEHYGDCTVSKCSDQNGR